MKSALECKIKKVTHNLMANFEAPNCDQDTHERMLEIKQMFLINSLTANDKAGENTSPASAEADCHQMDNLVDAPHTWLNEYRLQAISRALGHNVVVHT